jgi:hypothetical protein
MMIALLFLLHMEQKRTEEVGGRGGGESKDMKRHVPVNNALGVVKTINAENDLAAGTIGPDDPRGLVGHVGKSLVGYADRQRPDADGAAAKLDELVAPVNLAPEAPGAAVQKVAAVVLDVEPDEVAAFDVKAKHKRDKSLLFSF